MSSPFLAFATKNEPGKEQNNMSQMRIIKSIERVENDSCENSVS